MLVDILLSLVADGMVSGAQSRRIPKVLRILLAVIITVFFFSLGGFMLLGAVTIGGGIGPRLVCGGIAALCWGYLVFFIRGVWRAMR